MWGELGTNGLSIRPSARTPFVLALISQVAPGHAWIHIRRSPPFGKRLEVPGAGWPVEPGLQSAGFDRPDRSLISPGRRVRSAHHTPDTDCSQIHFARRVKAQRRFLKLALSYSSVLHWLPAHFSLHQRCGQASRREVRRAAHRVELRPIRFQEVHTQRTECMRIGCTLRLAAQSDNVAMSRALLLSLDPISH